MRIKTISFSEHYIKMEREFKRTPAERIIQILNLVVTLGCFIAYLCVDGKELFMALYIPLDVALVLSKTLYYWYYYYQDLRHKQDKKLLDQAIDELNASDDQKDVPLLTSLTESMSSQKSSEKRE